MATTGAFPGLSELLAWPTEHLTEAADYWDHTAERWYGVFTEVWQDSLSVDWTGETADRLRNRTSADRTKVNGLVDHLQEAAKVARVGASDLSASRSRVRSAVDDIHAAGFNAGEDLSVTDRRSGGSFAARAARQAQAQALAGELRHRALQLVACDQQVAGRVTTAMAGINNVRFAEDGGPGDPGGGPGLPKRQPQINGPASAPQYEQNKYDLQDTFPDGQGPTFGGDRRTVDANGNPVDVPDSPGTYSVPTDPNHRPIPTGTAIGPDGRRYGFFSTPDRSLNEQNAPPHVNIYSTPGRVYDFTDPQHPVDLGALSANGVPIYQASGAYDAANRRMVIVGNTSNSKDAGLTRGLWVADVDPNNPNGWVSNLHQIGNVSLPGSRESQLVALKGGGFMLVGADDKGPVSAIASNTVEGLKTAPKTDLVTQGMLPTVYGPTVTDLSYDPQTGLETVNLRVSDWVPTPNCPYNPQTFTSTFTVQH
jgi:hypothetical protein